MKEEIWKPAKYIAFDGTKTDYTNHYEVSNTGKVRSLERTKSNRFTEIPVLKCDMKQYLNKDGYYNVFLHLNGKKKTLTVQRLVLSSFKENEWFEGAEANHRDECTTNNNLENLEWLKKSDNIVYGTAIERKKKKLTNGKKSKQVIQFEINTKKFLNEYPSTIEAERQTGISHTKICMVCNGKRKKAGGYYWSYKRDAV